jgi:PKD repeat protein/lysophospholipase L1-like esterase
VAICSAIIGGSVLPVLASPYGTTVLADNPSLYWPSDEGSGGTLNDAAAGARNATLWNTAAWSNVGLVAGSSASLLGLNGQNGYASTYPQSQAAGLPLGPSRSIEFWFASTDYTAPPAEWMVSFWGGGNAGGGPGTNRWTIAIQGGASVSVDDLLWGQTEYGVGCASSGYFDGKPHMVDYTGDGTTNALYLDGKLCATAKQLNNNTWGYVCGVAIGAGANYACGAGGPQYQITPMTRVGQLSIYPTTLTPTQIQNHFAGVASKAYVALGDSYSSGEGVPPFLPGTDIPADTCHRSAKAYPELILNRPGVPPVVDFWACSGAAIGDFYNPKYSAEPRQLDHLSAPVTLVTVGVGGNDIDFRGIGEKCTDAPVGPGGRWGGNSNYIANCETVLEQPTSQRIDGLTNGSPYSLKTLYRDITAKASTARVFVVGYINPLPLPDAVNGDCQADIRREDNSNVGFWYNVQFTVHQPEVIWMETVVARLNAAIQLNALDAGFYFVDNSLTLANHDVCGNDKEHWVHGVVLQNGFTNKNISNFSFHPTDKGQAAIADAVASAIAAAPAGGFVSTVLPQQTVQQLISVSPGQLQFVVQSAWPGSDVQLSVTSPSGVVYDRTTQASGVIHILHSNGETFAIPGPAAGQWTVKLYGANVSPAGERVRVDTTQIPNSAFAPVAAMKASTDRGVIPTTIQFDGSGSGSYGGATIASYVWDFGDGTPTVSGAAQTHAFTAPGLHKVTLTVTDNKGQSNSATRNVFFTATDQPPSASFMWGVLDPSTPTEIGFDGSASTDIDGQVTGFAWNFGDGTIGTGISPIHNYAASGTYPVTLTATDNGGLTASACIAVTTGRPSNGPIQACTATALTSRNNPSVAGQPVMLTAAVSPLAPVTATPVGSVSFYDGSALLGTAALDATGSASITTSTLAIGHHNFTAVYPGNSSFAGSSSTRLVQVVRNSKIGFSSTRDGHVQVYVMNPDGTQQTRLTFNSAQDSEPILSPDGTRVAFTSTRSGNLDIWVMNAAPESATNVARNLTQNAATDVDPTWSPDGNKIAFASNRSGKFQIWLMNADGTGPTRLTNDSGNDVNPAWSPDGSTMAFASDMSGRFQIYIGIVSLSPAPTLGAIARLTNNSAKDVTPAWSPDSGLIAYSSTASGNAEVWVISSRPGGAAVQETSHPDALDTLPSWSPDGTKLAFTSTQAWSLQIFEIAYNASGLGTGQVQVTAGATNEAPNWCCSSAP